MPKAKKKSSTSKRKITDIGLRRMATWGGKLGDNAGMGKRHHDWLCHPDGVCEPMQEKLHNFSEDPNWRIFRIMAEFIEGFEFLDKLRGEVSIFGSARAPTDDPNYKQAKKLGGLLAKNGYTVITGGGPGIMEAANWGAFDAGGESVGLDIELPTEQRRNQFVTRSLGFHYFFTRKVMLSAAAQAYVFFPGGFGTLDEMTEMVTLVQTGKIPPNVPIILFGKKFWQPFLDWVVQVMFMEDRYISKEDLKLLHLVDTAEDAIAIIKKTRERPYGSHETMDEDHWKVKTVGKKK
jgi:uncharacterized protein (TIGR00730 family)